jgi:septum formation protein
MLFCKISFYTRPRRDAIITVMKILVLASKSPRRSQLLSQCGIPHEVFEADHDPVEDAVETDTADHGALAEHLALSKLRHARGLYKSGAAIILCADTIVVAEDGSVMGKPASADDARRMLRELSGRAHYVLTGVALEDTKTGRRAIFHERTTVVFRELSPGEIDRYVASGEPMDKAGAYGIQGLAGAFVSRVEGCYSNVVGLPLSRLAESLKNDFGFDVTVHWIKPSPTA